MACLKLVTILFACVIIVPITLTSPSLSMKYYRRYNFETGNCSSGTPTKDKQDCLRQCSTSSDCIAFKYSTSIGTCIRCFENEVSSITFGGSSLYLLRGASVFQRFSDVETYIYGTIRFLIKIECTLMNSSNPYWYFLEITAIKDGMTSLMMKMTLQSNSDVDLISLINNAWIGHTVYTSPVVFKAGVSLDTVLLVTAEFIKIYFNTMYCCSYPVNISKNYSIGVGVYGTVNIKEFSF
ncbi:hypothetical protein BgiBS90_006840 [Biomphalaria glabrata]|uniref:Apple domain-containing protein n=1 Tax=Biomphalaria glabrata TaxID=6526 RepID=A0A2C9KR53_BIOGL|nr:hypothetical protein BgiBS90_006840 [Biomphalaria glabrata]